MDEMDGLSASDKRKAVIGILILAGVVGLIGVGVLLWVDWRIGLGVFLTSYSHNLAKH